MKLRIPETEVEAEPPPLPVIVHLFGTMNRGGAEMRTLELLRKRVGRERHVFIAMSGKPGALDDDIRCLGHTVLHRALTPSFAAWFVPWLRTSGATHVHSHVQFASGYLLTLARLAGVRSRIAHFRSVGDGRRATVGRSTYRALGGLLVRLNATSVIAVSSSVAQAVAPARRRHHRRGGSVRIVYNQIDGGRFPRRASAAPVDGSPRLIAVGRLDHEKNPQRMIEILAVLRLRRPSACLSLIGPYSPAQYSKLEARARCLDIAEGVALMGPRDDVPALLTGSDLFISTTTREGMPGAMVESAAAGTPAVVSAIAPNEEVAALLPSIVCVPLDASDDEWCDVIEDILDARIDRFDPQRVRRWFDRSPFALDDHGSRFDDLWV